MFPKWLFLGAEETVSVGFCSFILSSGYRYAPSPWLIFNFHFPLIRIGARVVQWLTCPPVVPLRLSLVVRGVWWEGGKQRRERTSSLFLSHHPLLLLHALREDNWGRVRCSGGTLASHWCDPGSNPGVDSTCGLSLLLVLSFAPRGFSPGTLIFPSP